LDSAAELPHHVYSQSLDGCGLTDAWWYGRGTISNAFAHTTNPFRNASATNGCEINNFTPKFVANMATSLERSEKEGQIYNLCEKLDENRSSRP